MSERLTLAVPSLPFAQSPAVVVQLQSSTGTCWGQSYSAPASRNDAARWWQTNGQTAEPTATSEDVVAVV